jgi:hypothetical protein
VTSTPQAQPAQAEPAEVHFSHSGQRFLLGYGGDFYGIWDRLAPGPPIQRFPMTDEGWASAWQLFNAWEPTAAEVAPEGAPAATPQAAQAQPVQQPQPVQQVEQAQPVQPAPPNITFTHSGQRFLLGYGADFYGIWDRLAPGPPIQRFPMTDDGWRQVWQIFAAWEPNAAEVH